MGYAPFLWKLCLEVNESSRRCPKAGVLELRLLAALAREVRQGMMSLETR